MKNAFVLLFAILLFAASVMVISPGTITGFLSRTGQFTLGNEEITATHIYLNYVEATDTATDCTITGVENTTKAVTATVTVQDNNGNCDEFTSNNGTAYFCDYDAATCTASNAKHTVTDLEYDVQWGDSDEYCNLTGSADDWQFYEVNGTWTVNVSVTDGTDTDELKKLWDYNEIRAVTYPADAGDIDLGSLTLSAWNDGKGQALIQNGGNIIHNLAWNATDFEGDTFSDTFEIDGLDFIIDDDSERNNDTAESGGVVTEVNISTTPTTTVNFYPTATGLLNCSSVACSNANATMNIYWHALLPSGLHEDTYTDTIQVSTSDH